MTMIMAWYEHKLGVEKVAPWFISLSLSLSKFHLQFELESESTNMTY